METFILQPCLHGIQLLLTPVLYYRCLVIISIQQGKKRVHANVCGQHHVSQIFWPPRLPRVVRSPVCTVPLKVVQERLGVVPFHIHLVLHNRLQELEECVVSLYSSGMCQYLVMC